MEHLLMAVHRMWMTTLLLTLVGAIIAKFHVMYGWPPKSFMALHETFDDPLKVQN